MIDQLQTEHMHDHLEQYLQNSLSASKRRVLITKWVGMAWVQVSQKKEMIQRAFKKCGISVPIDGSGDAEINIRGLEGYIVRNIDTDLASEEENMFELDSVKDRDEGFARIAEIVALESLIKISS